MEQEDTGSWSTHLNLEAQSVRPAKPPTARPRGLDGIPLIWEPGDVILDLYEVRPFDERTPFFEGGMGRVNCIWHRGWHRLLAVKSVHPDRLASATAVANFQREAEVWVDQLGLHPHVVSCHYVRVLGGLPRLFLDLVPGGNLKEWIDSGQLYEDGPELALERRHCLPALFRREVVGQGRSSRNATRLHTAG